MNKNGDIHTHRCFIDSIGEVAVGETIRFKLQIPNADWIDVQGVVVYKYPNAGLGVRFVSISAEADLNFLNGWSKPRHTDRNIGNEESVAQGTRIAAALNTRAARRLSTKRKG